MHVLLTAHPQARNKVLVQMFTLLKKKKKVNVLIYSKILEGHLANLSFFIIFWVFLCVCNSFIHVHTLSSHAVKVRSGKKKKQALCEGLALG